MAPHDHPLQASIFGCCAFSQQVVRFNGFSATRTAWNDPGRRSAPALKQLEGRLGVRLCERGRSGFYLAEQGKQVHSAMLDLLGWMSRGSRARSARHVASSGALHFGTVDAMLTNPDFDLAGALTTFHRRAPKVQIEFDIAAPQALAQGLLSGRYHVVLTPSQPFSRRVRTVDVFDGNERAMFCFPGHPLFEAPAGR